MFSHGLLAKDRRIGNFNNSRYRRHRPTLLRDSSTDRRYGKLPSEQLISLNRRNPALVSQMPGKPPSVALSDAPTPSMLPLLSSQITDPNSALEGENKTVPNSATSVQAKCTSSPTHLQDRGTGALWTRAASDLDSKERSILSEFITPGTELTKTTLGSIQENIRALLDANNKESWKIEWRGKEILFREVGNKILGWVDKFKGIGDIIAQYDPYHAALPWAAFRFLLQICISKAESISIIMIGLEKVSHLIARCAVYELLYLRVKTTASAILEGTLVKLYTAILKYLAKAIECSKENIVKAFFTTTSLSKRFVRLEELEKTAAEDSQMAEAQYRVLVDNKLEIMLAGEFTKLQKLLKDSPKAKAMHGLLPESDRPNLLAWLSTVPYMSHHKRISEARLEGTVDWLAAKKEYQAWQQSTVSKLLLLRGIPGAGKTYIASKVIDMVVEISLNSTVTNRLAYFYCDQSEENRRIPEKILSTLVQQLAQSCDDQIAKPVVEIYAERVKTGQTTARLSLGESQDLLIKLADIHGQTTICIDALDEVHHETRAFLLEVLKEVIVKSKGVVKIFATSRNNPDIIHQFLALPRIDLEPDDNEDDINHFVNTEVKKTILHGRLRVDEELRDEICHILRNRSKGMFQLAALQITFLCGKKSEKAIRNSLKALPETLKGAYTEIYAGIQAQDTSDCILALNAFRWIKYSKEPLNAKVLLDAVGADVGKCGKFSLDNSITEEIILEVCRNLIIFDKRLDTFRFAHLSVEEYLETILLEIESHRYLAKVCLSLLCTPDFPEKYIQKTEAGATFEASYQERHLLLYASMFWPWHLSRCEAGFQADILDTLVSCFTISGHFHDRWWDYLRSYQKVPQIKDSQSYWNKLDTIRGAYNADPLFTTSTFGLTKTFTSIFISTTVAESSVQKFFLNACRFGYVEIVRFLFGKGADVSASDEDGITPLLWAVRDGYEVAPLLIDNGADVSAADKDKETPLHRVTKCENEDLVSVLIAQGADVSAVDKNGETPMHWAVTSGNLNMARLLMANGTDLSVTNVVGDTPLTAAISQGQEEMVLLQVENCEDIDTRDKHGATPLHWVSSAGLEKAARRLIEKGADVSALDIRGCPPLLWALFEGHQEIAQLLIENKASTCVVSNNGATPLYWAASYGHERLVKIILENGTDVCAVNSEGETALHGASFSGHTKIAEMLIEKGANVSAPNMSGETPLHKASIRRHHQVALLLIEKGSTISAVDKLGNTPLHLASFGNSSTCDKMARLLIEKGADVSAINKHGVTPERIASAGDRAELVRLYSEKRGVKGIISHCPVQDNNSRYIPKTTAREQSCPRIDLGPGDSPHHAVSLSRKTLYSSHHAPETNNIRRIVSLMRGGKH